MGDNRFSGQSASLSARETYGLETGRILDACRDRDCFEDTRVSLTGIGEELISQTNNVRIKCAEITGSYIGVEPIQFNRGFYSVDTKFYVTCTFETCYPIGQLQEFKGVAVLEKRVVLYGGESNVSVFRSSNNTGNYCAIPEPVCGDKIVPEAVVEVLQPVVLGARIVERCGECHCCCSCNDVPVQITDTLGGALANDNDETFRNRRYLAVSLGLFSVVRLVRDGQFLIEAREYCIPEKECIAPAEDDPCGTFRKMPFPAAEFCPQSAPLTANNGRRSCCGS